MDLEYYRKRIVADCPQYLAEILCSTDTEKAAFVRLLREDREARDSILDSSQLVSALMERDSQDQSSPYLYLYVGIRFCLRKRGIQSRDVADYTAWVCSHFLYSGELTANSDLMQPKRYIDTLSQYIEMHRMHNNYLQENQLRLHLGNYLLFLTGLLNRVIDRYELNGGYPMETCETLGSGSFQTAAPCTENPEFFGTLSREFLTIRKGLADFAKAGFV
jgi:hypothetical protein